MTVIQCCDLSLGYEGKCVLSHLELSVQEGDYLAIVGENGAGKSTLMKCLFGIYSKDSGTITLEGKEVNFKNSKGKKYFAGFIAIILVAAMVLSLCITIFS